MSLKIPEEFIKYVFEDRRKVIELITSGKKPRNFFVEFTRHTPAIISYGPAGINGSIKGVGFVLKREFLEGVTRKLEEFLKSQVESVEGSVEYWGEAEEARVKALKLLLKEVYVKERIDFTLLSSIELAKKHSWINFKANPVATILFFTPPAISYEVRAEVEIHEKGIYWRYVNAVHDVFHLAGARKLRDWSKTPVYIFKIKEIYDNSPRKMGEKIL